MPSPTKSVVLLVAVCAALLTLFLSAAAAASVSVECREAGYQSSTITPSGAAFCYQPGQPAVPVTLVRKPANSKGA